MKPNGLWLSGLYKSKSKDRYWIDFILNEGLNNWYDPNKTRYFIIKYDKKNVLHLSTIKDIEEFSKKYYRKGNMIDWEQVAKDYKGIDISPYKKSLRFNKKYLWYYPWDCSSQCIWDFTIIKDCIEINVDDIKKDLVFIK